MPKLFISYRREDSEGLTGRIYDRLVAHFGKEEVFFDIDTIPPGVDFVEHLGKAVSQCDILLAIIGEHWLNICHEDGHAKVNVGLTTQTISSASRYKRRWGGTFR
jgi:TIR domain